jgi:uncharacterized protein YndB with AHSA1/START domain
MTERSSTHSTFVIERSYAARPAKVFQAFADPAIKKKWFGGPPGWTPGVATFDFREGGRETDKGGGPPGGAAHDFDCLYYDIVENERIVYAYDMVIGDRRISVSLATVELRPEGAGTRLKLTEQGVYLDGYEDAGQREEGTQWLLGELAKVVEG